MLSTNRSVLPVVIVLIVSLTYSLQYQEATVDDEEGDYVQEEAEEEPVEE